MARKEKVEQAQKLPIQLQEKIIPGVKITTLIIT